MSNTIPLKEKLDFQQYQLVINALSNIGIEIAIPEDVAHGHENELAGATLGENEQLFKIELPVVAPLFLTDKRGGELVLLTKEAYERFSLKEKELQILSTETYDKLLRKEKELEEFTKEAYNKLSLKEKELEAVSQKLSFKEKELDVFKRELCRKEQCRTSKYTYYNSSPKCTSTYGCSEHSRASGSSEYCRLFDYYRSAKCYQSLCASDSYEEHHL